MQRNAKIVVLTAVALLLAGLLLIGYASTLPIYTDSSAPNRISDEIAAHFADKVPQDSDFKEWFQQLRKFETPHKKIFDWGTGLAALGSGLLAIAAIHQRHSRGKLQSHRAIFFLWFLCWGFRVPGTIWYYLVRLTRNDYPWWGDTTIIPVFNETLSWLIGWGITAVLLSQLLKERELRFPAWP